MIWRFKDKKGIPDPRFAAIRRKLGLPPAPEIDYTTERKRPHHAYCPACGQHFVVNPFEDLAEFERLHRSACSKVKRELIVVRGK